MNKKQIGRNIQRIRQVQNITQAELAEMVHLSVVHISHIETGASMPSLDRKSTRLNSSHKHRSRMPSSA